MSHLFYSRRKQYTREWRVLFTLHRTDIVLGCIYVFISFYFFRTIGQSQVYNVVFPYFMASFVTAYITYNVCGPQVRGKTLLYFSGLPRERNVVWRSHTAFVLFIVICLEAITGVGIALKLGGAGITQVYRLHPEMISLPILTMACVRLSVYLRYTKWVILLVIVAGTLGTVVPIFWALDGFVFVPEELNNYIPARGYTLSLQCFYALGILGLSLVFQQYACKLCMGREVGEIQ